MSAIVDDTAAAVGTNTSGTAAGVHVNAGGFSMAISDSSLDCRLRTGERDRIPRDQVLRLSLTGDFRLLAPAA